MPLTYEHVGSKKPAKINTYMLTRAELLITLCYEIPCIIVIMLNSFIHFLEKIDDPKNHFEINWPLKEGFISNSIRI